MSEFEKNMNNGYTDTENSAGNSSRFGNNEDLRNRTYTGSSERTYQQSAGGQGQQTSSYKDGYYRQAGTYAQRDGAGSYQGTGNYQNAGNYRTGQTYQTAKKAPKKKGNFGVKVMKAAAIGLVFGLVAGSTFYGVNKVANIISPVATASSGEGGSDSQVNIVRTSSTDVNTYEAGGVADIVQECMPSIVAVNTTIVTTSTWFGQTYQQEGSGAGSGIILDVTDDGTMYILTNNHVIQDSNSISVTFNDESAADAQIKGTDPNADIAVLTVDYNSLSDETKNAVAKAAIGDSEALQVGEGAIAIGNALGYGQSVTTGTISAVNREVQMTDGTVKLIQTDAAINPGNSGGALLNTHGEVVGVNTIKYSETSVEGMGFAIPIDTALETATALIDGTSAVKDDENSAYLGIAGGTLNETTAQQYGYPAGIYVSMVTAGSAAERAGLVQGDIITGFNGETMMTMEDLQGKLAECTPGEQVTLTVQRQIQSNGDDVQFEEMELSTILGSKADAER